LLSSAIAKLIKISRLECFFGVLQNEELVPLPHGLFTLSF
jgi:hypothetical protein